MTDEATPIKYVVTFSTRDAPPIAVEATKFPTLDPEGVWVFQRGDEVVAAINARDVTAIVEIPVPSDG